MQHSNKALLVIDMQEEYVGVNSKYNYNGVELITAINSRIQQAQKNNEIIIYIKNKRVLRSGVKIPEFVQSLNVVTEHIYYKEKSSLFSNSEITQFLKENAINVIEVLGVDGNCCVASSAVGAINEGYEVILPCKYIGVLNRNKFEKTKQKLKQLGVIVLE